MGKKLSELNQQNSATQEEYLLIDKDNQNESYKIKLKDINIANFADGELVRAIYEEIEQVKNGEDNLKEGIKTQTMSLLSEKDYLYEELSKDINMGYSDYLSINYKLGGIASSTGVEIDVDFAIRSNILTFNENIMAYFSRDELIKGIHIFKYNISDKTFISFYDCSSLDRFTFEAGYNYRIVLFNDVSKPLPVTVEMFSYMFRMYKKHTNNEETLDYLNTKIIEDITNGYSDNIQFDYELGGIASSTGLDVDVDFAIKTNNLTFDEDTTIYFSKDELVEGIDIFKYDISTGAFVSYENCSSLDRYTFSQNYIYRIVIFSDTSKPLPTTVKMFSGMCRMYKNYVYNNTNNVSFGAFMKFGVIGDSLSVGWTDTLRQRNTEYSWVQYLAKMCNNEGVNFGVSGVTTASWFTTPKCYDDLIKLENKCQAYIIGIGTNDTGNVGTINDIDLNNMYNNANSFYGNYAKIIQTVFSVNPMAKIFLFTLPYPREEEDKNIAIKTIANMFDNVYVVDLANDYNYYFKSDYIAKFAEQGHFSAGGYINLAKINLLCLSKTMLDNAQDFTDVDVIPYYKNKFGITHNKKSGEIITIDDGLNEKIQSLKLFGKTTQNGTPTPDAPVPLVSVGDSGSFEVEVYGKNLLENLATTKTVNGLTFTINADKSITINGTASATTMFNINTTIKLDGTYILSGCPSEVSQQGVEWLFYDGAWQRDIGSGKTFTTSKAKAQKCVINIPSGKTITNATIYPMIRLATETDSTYEPCNKQTLTMPYELRSIPNTSVKDVKDFTIGKTMQKVHQLTFNGSEGWEALSNGRVMRYVESQYAPNVASNADLYKAANAICNIAPISSWANLASVTNGVAFGNLNNIAFKVTGHTESIEAWKSYLASNPVTVIYELKTPIEIPLTKEELINYGSIYINKDKTTILSEAFIELDYISASNINTSTCSNIILTTWGEDD